MATYYAIERSSEYLVHYGVPGMKWGIRKARVIKGNRGFSYYKAKRKLAELTPEQKALKKNASAAMREYNRAYDKKHETRSIRGTLGLDRKSRNYRKAKAKMLNAVDVYTDSLNENQRRRLRNHIIRG